MDLYRIFYYLRKCKHNSIEFANDCIIKKITQTNEIQAKILKTLDCTYFTGKQYLSKNKITTIKPFIEKLMAIPKLHQFGL
jgi:hypothetical protein